MNEPFFSFPQGKHDEIRVGIAERKLRRTIDIRVYTSLADPQSKIPTGKGISLPFSDLPELKRAIARIEETLAAEGIGHE